MADETTYRVSRNILMNGRHEVYADERYIGVIHEKDGQFAADRFIRGRVGIAASLGEALDMIIAAGPEA